MAFGRGAVVLASLFGFHCDCLSCQVEGTTSDVSAAFNRCETPSRESYVYDLHCIVGRPGWRKIEIGGCGVFSDMTPAYSSMVKPVSKERGGPGVTREIWDQFLGAIKPTELCRDQLNVLWEADVDLRSNEWETILGAA